MIKKIIVVGALPSSLTNFRGELLKHFVAKDFETIAMASDATPSEVLEIEALGVRYQHYPVRRSGLNPLRDALTFIALLRFFLQEKPDVVLAYTVKPIIWGGLAARVIPKLQFFGLVTGLGFAFQTGGILRRVLTISVVALYRLVYSAGSIAIFQNPDNRETFRSLNIIAPNEGAVVDGSGVDLSVFQETPLPNGPVFLLIARLLGEKGIREYVAAAELVKKEYPHAKFHLVGPEDPSPDGITLEELRKINMSNAVEYLGKTNDVRPFLRACSVFVLPSYHEGLPRTVLEAMAVARPILTTDVPGCRETVMNGINGWLVPKKDVNQLAFRMKWFIENQSEWERMSCSSRLLASERFDVHKVNCNLLRIIEEHAK